jgi:hypothetical protein
VIWQAALVIACSGRVCDTSSVTIAPPPPTMAGIPFGASQVWDALGTPGTAGFTLAQDPVTPETIMARIDSAYRRHVRIILNLPGGSHDKYLSVIRDTLRFDHAKWSAALVQYGSPEIGAKVAAGVAAGVVIAGNYMDEPHTCGKGDGNTWGPCGELTKARVDSLCAEGRALFPSLPAAVTHQHQLFEPSKSYRVCQTLIDQYKYGLGSVTQFRVDALTMANRDGLGILFGANVLNGGVRDPDGVWDCRTQGGYLGQDSPLCQMTPVQVDSVARALGPWGCGFRMWRWDEADLRDYQPMMANVSAYLAGQQGRRCSVR